MLLASVPIGAATATNLAARYAGTDLAAPHRRGRALGTVLGTTTLGIVIGPNPADHPLRLAGRLSAATDGPPRSTRCSRRWAPQARLALATISVTQLVDGGVMAGLIMASTSYGVLNGLAASLAAIVLVAVLRVGRAATRPPVSSRIASAVPCEDAAAGAGVCPR